MKILFYSFGCKVASCEVDALAALCCTAGHIIVTDVTVAQAIIFHACTVTAAGDKRAIAAIRRARRDNPQAITILMGCYPQAYPQAAMETGADYVLGMKRQGALLDLLSAIEAGDSPMRIQVPDFTREDDFEPLPVQTGTAHTRGFLKIQDGCNRFCAYCIVPYARGRARSLPLEAVRSGAEKLRDAGHREIVLCGINLGFYGEKWGGNLVDAVEACAAVDGIERVRLGSLEPDRIDSAQLMRLKGIREFCPQFYLSLQSGCDRTLKAMGRYYTATQYAQLCTRIRDIFPSVAIMTDFMVGFPSESDDDFNASLAFAREIGFASMHVFRYSPRVGTRAATMPQVSESIKTTRSNMAIAAAREMQEAYWKKCIGTRVEVLFEREKGDGFYRGHTRSGIMVRVAETTKKSLRNCLKYVIIEEWDEHGCLGRLVEE